MRLRTRLCACSAALAIALPTTALPALAAPSDDGQGSGVELEVLAQDQPSGGLSDEPAVDDEEGRRVRADVFATEGCGR